jgi:hypothetical protein
MSGCYAADAHVEAFIVICPVSFCCLILCYLNGFDDILFKPFMAGRSVLAFDIGILLRFSGLFILDLNPVLRTKSESLLSQWLATIGSKIICIMLASP